MGQGACCENNANDPNLSYYNGGRPISTTTQPRSSRQSRRSQRDLHSPRSPKYRESVMQPEVSTYVKEKMKELP